MGGGCNSQDLNNSLSPVQPRQKRFQEQGDGEKQGRRAGQRTPSGTVWLLGDLLKGGAEVSKMFHQNHGSGICFRFQEDNCPLGSSCTRQHVCIGCGGARVNLRATVH